MGDFAPILDLFFCFRGKFLSVIPTQADHIFGGFILSFAEVRPERQMEGGQALSINQVQAISTIAT